jgi:OPA family glycerol-3-phosphate transporter-like MFS transporter
VASDNPASRPDERASRLRRWQWLTVGLMVVGYAGFYLCRSNLSATLPSITEDLVARGMDPARVRDALGWALTLGTIGYAIGKFAAGSLTDVLGGRRNYLIGMAGAIACTMLIPLGSSLPVFTLTWFANRLIQSLGWPGMVKITSRWFSYSTYGIVMGVISLSFLFGDAAARAFIGRLLDAGFGWRAVFWIAGGVLAVLLVVNFALIRESPTELNLPEPKTNPDNLYGRLGDDPHPEAAGPLLATLARSRSFWIVCLLSLGLTLLRETFNNWTPTYLVDGVGLSKGAAAGSSALFPFFGGVSVILAGYLGDRFGRLGRATLIFSGILLCCVVLAILGSANFSGRSLEALILVALAGFLLIGPYSYLAGAISLDFGGKRAGATASGLIDGVGYLFGGVVAGTVVSRMSDALGWQGVFKMLAAVALLSALVAAFFLADQSRPAISRADSSPGAGGQEVGVEIGGRANGRTPRRRP